MITSLTVHRVRVPFRAPFATAAGTWTARDSWLLRVTTDAGTTGWGEALVENPGDQAALDQLATRLRADDVPDPRTLESEGSPGMAVLGALAAATARIGSEAMPDGPGVGVNATIGAVDRESVGAEAAGRVAAGFRTLKLKIAPDDTLETVVGRVAAARAAAGSGTAIRLDANAAWDEVTAEAILRAVEPYGLQYVEQPVAARDVDGMARLRRRTGVPLAADEAVISVEAARIVLDRDAADVLIVKPARVGGITGVARIEAMATSRGVPVVVTSAYETGIGLAAALAAAAWVSRFSDLPAWPGADRDHGLATADLLDDDLLAEPLQVREGRMRVPAGIGSTALGITVDEAAVERYSVEPA